MSLATFLWFGFWGAPMFLMALGLFAAVSTAGLGI